MIHHPPDRNMSSLPLYFIHISDTHIGPTKEYELYGANTYTNALRVVETINALPLACDFVLHTGDIAASPNEDAYRLAAEVFGQLRAPIYFVTGNHDSAVFIKKYLTMGPADRSGGEEHFLTYAFERKGIRCIALDARGPDEIDPRGILEEHQFAFLEQELQRDAMPAAVFIHFPALPLDSIWLDRNMLLLNGEQLHAVLARHRERLRGVFFGHVHRGMQVLQDGILYSSVASTIGQFMAWPHDEDVRIDCDHPPCFNLVALAKEKTIVKEHVVGGLGR